jgi:hypothetical protein
MSPFVFADEAVQHDWQRKQGLVVEKSRREAGLAGDDGL